MYPIQTYGIDNKYEDDIVFQKIFEKVKNKKYCTLIDKKCTLDEVLYLNKKFNFVITNRRHAINATINFKPAIAILTENNNYKILPLLEKIYNNSKHYINLFDSSINSCFRKIINFYEERDKISTHLKTIVPKFDEETKAHLAYIKEAVIKYGKSKKNN